jgi:CelD/BcsL family acetyltransferase involved in cellulose biosynthesis
MAMASASRVTSAGAPAAIRISVVEDFGALAARKADWNALVERSHTATVFQTYEFHESWWRVFGGGARAAVLLAENGTELLGVAPLMVIERRFLGRTQRVVQFIGTRSFDYCDFLIDTARDEVLPLLLGRFAELVGEFDVLYLRDIPGTSPTLGAMQQRFESHKPPIDVRVLYQAPTRLFNDPAADRQLANKKSLKRHYNYFRRTGELEVRHCRSLAEVAPYLKRFFDQHVRRRAVTDTPSLFVEPRMREFFTTLASAVGEKGWLLFTIVLYNGEPIAMHYGFEYGGRIIWYKPAFDMELAKHSPGEVLIKSLIEYALEQGAAELDFTIGEEAFKYRFANHVRTNYAVRLYRRRMPYELGRLLIRARALVERYPAVTRVARRIASRWRGEPWL